MTSLVRTERRGEVAILWMADSARHNALSVILVSELLNALQDSKTAGARAVVFASKEKAFCAGADIRDMLENGWLDAASKLQKGATPPDLFEAIETDSRPIIAAVDGLALGGGVELCLACDLVVAAPSASFMFPELSLGVLPNTALARLPLLIGVRAAADLILTRRRIAADEALRLGLISSITEGNSAVELAVESAQAIVSTTPPVALAAAKRQLKTAPGWDAIRAILGEMDSAEWREGTSAFVEKRAPNYDKFWSARSG